MATPFLKVVTQRHDCDCGVACLAMLLGTSYETVLMAFQHNVMTRGTTIRQLVAAAARLGYSLRWTRKVNLEEDTGLLSVRSSAWKMDHMVLLKEDLIIDTDLTIWEAPVFMSAYAATPLSIIILCESE